MFKDIIIWFEKQNNWLGWTCFTLLYMVNISILLPGIWFILMAGFVFGHGIHFLLVGAQCLSRLW